MTAGGLLAVGIGAMLGAWLRWGLGAWLNPLFPTVPLGTLVANLAGGYLVGAAVAVFHINAELPAELKLFFITGFLGALTTFSTFSAENLPRNHRPKYGLSAADLVYEYYTEAGTTRFIALFYGQDAETVGPILMGMKKPVHVLQRGDDVSEIVNMAAVAVVDVQEAQGK